MAHRDDWAVWRPWSSSPVVSSREPPGRSPQNPATRRDFLLRTRAPRQCTAETQTSWRWSQSRANPSRGPGNSRDLGPSPWQSGRNKVPGPDFPASRNSERNRDEQGTLWTEQGKKAGGGLPREGQATGAASMHDQAAPLGISGRKGEQNQRRRILRTDTRASHPASSY
jgi:hypothetical protein